jgi:hypothetical protein
MNIQKLITKILIFLPGLGLAVPSVEELLKEYDKIMGPENFEASVTMSAHREDGTTRDYGMKMAKKGTDKFRIWFSKPASSKGQEILRTVDADGTDVSYIYIPNLKRASRIGGRDNFQGGDFNNADVLRVNYSLDYTGKATEEKDEYKLDLTAKTEKASYDKVNIWMRKKDFMPIKGKFYGKSGKLLRSAEFSDYKEFKPAGFMRPAKITMKNEVTVERYSVMTTESMDVGYVGKDSDFVLSKLGK